MISSQGLARAAAVICLGLASAAPAAADTSHTSTITQLMVLEPGHKDYKQFRGAVWLTIDKAATNYRWGGAQCPGKDVSENTVQLMFAAFRAGDQVTLEYTTTTARDKQYRCITGVAFSK